MLWIERLQLEPVFVLPATSGLAIVVAVDAVGVGVAVSVQRIAVSTVAGSRVTAVAHHDARGPVEAVLQVVPDYPETGEAHPTGFDCAGTRHTVAFTFLPHFLLDVLEHRKRNVKYRTAIATS